MVFKSGREHKKFQNIEKYQEKSSKIYSGNQKKVMEFQDEEFVTIPRKENKNIIADGIRKSD